jgi:hypothetical protein
MKQTGGDDKFFIGFCENFLRFVGALALLMAIRAGGVSA